MNNCGTGAQKKGKAPNSGRNHLFQEPVQAGTCRRKATPKEKSLSEITHTHIILTVYKAPTHILAHMHSQQPHKADITDIIPFTEEKRTLRLSDTT